MNKKVIFRGVGTAMVTPMKEDGAVNYPVFRELLEMQVENKADAVVIAGTTGEGSTLSDQEHIELVKFAVHEIRGRIPVIAGAGSNNTAHAVYLSRECERAGADALLHYNVPSSTGVNIYPATYKRLSEIDNITACKEASGNFSQLAKIASLCKDELTIYSGNDDQVTSALALGAQGVISVMSNILPAETHEICEAYFRGDSERSDSLQMKYLELIEALFMDVNPIPVKQAMRAMGYQVGGCRLPLCDMDPTNAERLYQVLKQYGLLRDGVRAGSVTVQRAKNAGHVIRSNV